MTRKEYSEYEAAVAEFFANEGVTNLSRMDDDESFFSWRPCDCCRTYLGGDRIKANGYNPSTKEVQEYTICVDCEYYVEYGQLDDMTMLDMDKESN